MIRPGAQVDLVNRASSPSAGEVAWAQRVLQAAEQADGPESTVDARMADRLVLLRARAILREAQRWSQRPMRGRSFRASCRAFWNERYAAGEFAHGTTPDDFLVQTRDRIAPKNRVPCQANGEGRRGLWLAQQGMRVTSVHVPALRLDKAGAVAWRAGVHFDAAACDVTGFDLGIAGWDAIASIFLHLPRKPRRAQHRRCIEALQPGAVSVHEGYSVEQPPWGIGGPKEPELPPALDDVLADLDGLGIMYRYAGMRAVHEGRLHHEDGGVARVVEGKATARARDAVTEPLFKLSSPQEGRDGPRPERHYDYINGADFPEECPGRPPTVELKAKAEEPAVARPFAELKGEA